MDAYEKLWGKPRVVARRQVHVRFKSKATGTVLRGFVFRASENEVRRFAKANRRAFERTCIQWIGR